MSAEQLQQVRDRVLPMLESVANDYRSRVPSGYPTIIDTPDQGVVGIQIDPNHTLFFTSDGKDLFADVYARSPRSDARSSASREKFGGAPTFDRRPIDPTISHQELRNLISELMNRWNFQPMIIHITDT